MLALAVGLRNPMPVHRGRPGNDEGSQPRHSAQSHVRPRRRRASSSISHPSRLRTRFRLRDGRQHLPRVRSRRASIAVERLLAGAGPGCARFTTTSMAKRGFSGTAVACSKGLKGLEQNVRTDPPRVDWDNPSLDFVKQTVLKKYWLADSRPAGDRSRPWTCGAALQTWSPPRSEATCAATLLQAGYDFAGGGIYGLKGSSLAQGAG